MAEPSDVTEPSGVKIASALKARGAPISTTAISPPEQGDALSGLTLAIAGVGPASVPNPTGVKWVDRVGPSDAWSVAVESETGWYVLLSQDCDIIRDEAHEPTVQIAPLILADQANWNDLFRNGYSSRRWAYPGDKFDLPEDQALVVDLAWTTSVLKGSLVTNAVQAVRALTGPGKAQFSEWLGCRTGRVPFPDDVVSKVLDPCYAVRSKLSRDFDKAKSPGSASEPARAVAAVERWFVNRDGMLVTFLGQVTGPRLVKAGFFNARTNDLDLELLARAEARLQTEVLKKIVSVDAYSGYQVKLVLLDLALMSAAQFQRFALLVR